MPLLYAITLFGSAALSFLLQPLIARQLLPLAGGAPAVWTTSLGFFQLMLLAGYFYSHALSRINSRIAFAIHFLLLLAAGVTLISNDSLAPDADLADWVDRAPVAALLAGLLLTVGLPYFALATTAPLLQSWFSRGGRNPYWLYAASNAGSLLGLLAYPFLFEPLLAIHEQRQSWRFGFFALTALVLLCGFGAFGHGVVVNGDENGHPSRWRRLRWIGLSALTASLLASVTAHLSTDIAPVPLLWVVPLALYLLTYIITFSNWPHRARTITARLAPMAICFSVVAWLTQATVPMALVAGIHLLGLTAIGFLCHGELTADKPDPKHLTDFYLCIALGGVLGGSFNAVLAPVLFSHLGPVEYPLMLALACLVRPRREQAPLRNMDLIWPFVVMMLTLAMALVVPRLLPKPDPEDEGAKLLDRVLRGGLTFGVPTAISFALVWRPVRFALCITGLLLVGMLFQIQNGKILEVRRNFFGTLTVSKSEDGQFILLTYGTTQHGQQSIHDRDNPAPLMYYHRKGPLGVVFGAKPGGRTGVVGLGCGAMAAYAKPGERWTFFEIDPGVVEIAKDERYFTFLKTCKGELDIVLGDARRRIAKTDDGEFDLLAIDAFNSDAVPVHLLTKEAIELYLKKLKPDGRLLLHLSNRYLDLPSLVGRTVKEIDPTLIVQWDDDTGVTEAERKEGKLGSTWVIIARSKEHLGPLRRFGTLHSKRGPIWTDDRASLWGTFKTDDD